MRPLVISFYTLGTPYEQEAQRLIHSCVELDIEADIVGLPSRGSWEKNCAIKPFFILEKLQKWNRPVLWVDADAVFLKFPDWREFSHCDFAVRVNEFLPKTHESRIVSNTIFARNNSATLSVLQKWCQATEKELSDKERVMEFWDQTALRDALNGHSSIQFLPMPLKFAKIFDFDNLFISEKEIVIEHYQASRRYKHLVHRFKHAPQNHCCH